MTDSDATLSSQSDSEEHDLPSMVVGIGASAGGLEALEGLFERLPDTLDLTFVVITHLSPDFKSLLDELLGRRTAMPVHLVEDGMPMRRNSVYVIPPATDMIVAGYRLYLTAREPREGPSLPIDQFLKSLASNWGEHSAAIILSGSGSDGAKGSKHVKEANGLVIVQDPETASFSSMPEAVIVAEAADQILPPALMGKALQNHVSEHPKEAPTLSKFETSDRQHKKKIMELLYGVSDIDFSAYKETTFERRVNRRMAATKCATLGDYVALLIQEPGEIRSLSDDLLIGVTQFFRDLDAFNILAKQVLEELIKKRAQSKETLRLWVAGCATGEEPYSLSILLSELYEKLMLPTDFQIFATDIQQNFLEKASRGIYAAQDMKGLSPERISRWFTLTSGGMYQVATELRKKVLFAQHDLMRDPPFTRVDLISCRNVLIYFNQDVQKRILSLFNFGMKPDGFLFLGPSEALGDLDQEFKAVSQERRIFARASDRSPPFPRAARFGARPTHAFRRTGEATSSRVGGEALLRAYSGLMRRYGPPSVLITADRQIVHSLGEGRQFLTPPEGLISLDILDMVDPALRAPLATAIERCRREKTDIEFPELALKGDPDTADAKEQHIRLSVQPIKDDGSDDIEFLAVIFERVEQGQEVSRSHAIRIDADSIQRERIEALEQDLQRTRESLQASLEEIETSNEELQSTNEELMASNEELQSTNEELSSVNEELHSVNAEYVRQNQELVTLHTDLESLLFAVDFNVIFVDANYMIRRFTKGAEKLFNLIHEDVGRRIADIRSQLTTLDLEAMLKNAIQTGEMIEQEHEDKSGKWWLIRCIPDRLRGHDGGAIITAVSIDATKQEQIKTERQQRELQSICKIVGAFSLEVDAEGMIISQQPQWETYTGQSFAKASGNGWLDMVHPDDRQRIQDLWYESDIADQSIDDIDVISTYRLWSAKAKDWRYVQSRAHIIRNAYGEIEGWFRVVVDVEDTVQAEHISRERENIMSAVIRSNSDLIGYVDTDESYRFVNERYEEFWGRPACEIEGFKVKDLLPTDLYEQVKDRIANALNGLDQRFKEVRESDGRELQVHYSPHLDRSGQVLGFVTHIRDLTALRQALEMEVNQEAFLSRMIDKLHDEVLIFDLESLAITFANQPLRQNLQYPAGHLSGQGITMLMPEYSEDRLRSVLKKANTSTQSLSTFLIRYDGTAYDAEVEVSIEQDYAQGRPVGTMIITDVSDRNAAASQLKERTTELATSNRDLEQFAFAISHDLKAPLRQITSFSGLIKDRSDTGLSPEAQGYLDQIDNSAMRMTQMVEGLLDYCRIQKTQRFQSVALDKVVNEAVDNLNSEIKTVKAVMEGIDSLPSVHGDEVLLTMLFQNLISNALKYAGDKPPHMVFEAKKIRGNRIRISVSDQGIGIPKEHAEDIFKIFRRLHAQDPLGSTGIGLALCQRIAEMHDGRIYLDTKYQGGARFLIDLMREEPQEQPAETL